MSGDFGTPSYISSPFNGLRADSKDESGSSSPTKGGEGGENRSTDLFPIPSLTELENRLRTLKAKLETLGLKRVRVTLLLGAIRLVEATLRELEQRPDIRRPDLWVQQVIEQGGPKVAFRANGRPSPSELLRELGVK